MPICDICQQEYPTPEEARSCKMKNGIPFPKYNPGQSVICSVPDQKNPNRIYRVKGIIKQIVFLKPNNKRNLSPHTIIYAIAIDTINDRPIPGAQTTTVLEAEIEKVIEQS
jgi:hypothetical protein